MKLRRIWFGHQITEGSHGRHGRVWFSYCLNPSFCNAIGFEWKLFTFSFRLSLILADNDCAASAITLGLGIPFLGSFWLTIDKAEWVKKLPGVAFVGFPTRGMREISIKNSRWALWWSLWVYPVVSRSSDFSWRRNFFHIDDFLFGEAKYSRLERIVTWQFVTTPEGRYPCIIRFDRSVWKRKRWPWSKDKVKAYLELEDGIPVPGYGMDPKDKVNQDDGNSFIYAATFPTDSVQEALFLMSKEIERVRQERGYVNWKPATGWPEYCLKEELDEKKTSG